MKTTDFDPRRHIRMEQSDLDASNLFLRVKELEDEIDRLQKCVNKLEIQNILLKNELMLEEGEEAK